MAPFLPRKIVSGGQTGVDRAALDAALASGIPCGGFAPKGRLAEDGPIPAGYPLEECHSAVYAIRTELNVLHSDATLILCQESLFGGTQLTLELCHKYKKPVCVVAIETLSQYGIDAAIKDFLAKEKPRVLNVAGPRESGAPGIHDAAYQILVRALGK